MGHVITFGLVVGMLAVFPYVAFPQEAATPVAFTFPVDKSQRISQATGAPYSAEEVHEYQRPQPDGTLTAQPPSTFRVYRDSEGRTRKDHPVSGTDFTIVEIRDPVARCAYFLDPQKKIAHRLKPPVLEIDAPHKVIAKAPAKTEGMPAPLPQGVEPLGTRMIEGVMAEGTRLTINALSSSSKRRHRAPSNPTFEIWNSAELEVRIIIRTSDSQMGDSVVRLTHISRSEPDPNLFKVPAGYAVVDENDSFSISITR